MFLKEMKLFTGNANPKLSQKICKYLKVAMGGARISRFPDGEVMVKIDDDVRGKDCFVVQPTSTPVNENLMELLIMLDSLKRASAKRITVVIPYFGYARQDRKDEGRVPITAKLVANLLTVGGAHRVIAIDLHARQLEGFFDIPVDHLMAEPVLCRYFRELRLENLVIVSPDVGNVKTASKYATHLGAELAIINKKRVSGDKVVCSEIIGDVKGRNVLMVDDMISTAGTVCSAASLVKERGAAQVIVGATHGLFCGPAIERVQQSPIDQVVVTDTIDMDSKVAKLDKLQVLTISELLGEAIKRIHKDESLSSLLV